MKTPVVTRTTTTGTPGRVHDWIVKLRVMNAKKIRVFVLDEADHMIGIQGHQAQSVRILR